MGELPAGVVEVARLTVDDLAFEDAFSRLDETVRTLEGGELSLAEMVEVYEQGVKLSEHCTQLLDAAELRVSQLAQGSDGEVKEVPFYLSGTIPAQGES